MIKLGVVTGLAFEAAALAAAQRTASAPLLVGRNGFGREAARAAAVDLIKNGATALLSFGIATGLDPQLRPGAVVVATEIRGENIGSMTTNVAWVTQCCGHWDTALATPLAHAPDIIHSTAEKARLFGATGAAAADMESYGIAEAAAAANIPFVAIRVVADAAEDALPGVALRATAPDGTVRLMAAVLDALTHPVQIPGLIRLGRRTALAKRKLQALADFGVPRRFFVVM